MSSYRGPALPFLGLYLSDYIMTDEGNGNTFGEEESISCSASNSNSNTDKSGENGTVSGSGTAVSGSAAPVGPAVDQKKIFFRKLMILAKPVLELRKLQEGKYLFETNHDIQVFTMLFF